MNCELEGIRKEAAVADLKILSDTCLSLWNSKVHYC
jgi:hypothetical protein